jgi:hypothetical protein
MPAYLFFVQLDHAVLLMLQMFLSLLMVPTAAITAWHFALSRMSRFTWRAYQITGALGAPVHELSHLLACLAFRLPVHRVALYTPGRGDGSLGYVMFSFNHRSLFNNVGMAVQGVAPLLGGSAIVHYVLKNQGLLSFPSEISGGPGWIVDAAVRTINAVIELGTSGSVGFALLLAMLVIAMHSIPSWADVRVGLKGLLMFGVTAIFAAAASEIVASYVSLGSSFQSLGLVVNHWIRLSLEMGLTGAVRLVTLAIIGGLCLVVIPGILFDAAIGLISFFTRHHSSIIDDE